MSVTHPTRHAPRASHAQARTAATAEAEARRLLWECRRGMRELEVLLQRFVDQVLPCVTAEERSTFAQLLALPDPVLAQYLLAGTPPAEARMAQLVGRIRALCRLGGG